jgi:hypothetical protein
VSTEPIAPATPPAAGVRERAASPAPSPAAGSCTNCGAALADDQRYCLECGQRRTQMSSVLRSGPPPRSDGPPAAPPAHAAGGDPGSAPRSNALTVIAGVGVLLLAMGVGVLIGRSSVSKSSPAPAQVISVASGGATPTAASTTPASSEASFTSDWPSGASGYTVQLQALPTSSPVSTVEAAKTSAGSKGAKSVGALKSDEFSGLPAGSYIVYSGVYHTKAEAEKALAGLKSKFPGAKVIHVAASGSSSSSTPEEKAEEAKEAKEGKGVGQSLSKPAPPSSVESLKKVKGKSYEEKSKNLPNVVSTG